MKRLTVLILLAAALSGLTACDKIMELIGRKPDVPAGSTLPADSGWAVSQTSAPSVPEWTRGKLWEEKIDGTSTNYLFLLVAEDPKLDAAQASAVLPASMKKAWDAFASEWTTAVLGRAAGRSLAGASPASYFAKTAAAVSARLPAPQTGLLYQSYWEAGSYTNRGDAANLYRVYLRVSFNSAQVRGIIKEAWKNSSAGYSAEVKTKVEESLKFPAE